MLKEYEKKQKSQKAYSHVSTSKPVETNRTKLRDCTHYSTDHQYTDQLARERRVRDEYYTSTINEPLSTSASIWRDAIILTSMKLQEDDISSQTSKNTVSSFEPCNYESKVKSHSTNYDSDYSSYSSSSSSYDSSSDSSSSSSSSSCD